MRPTSPVVYRMYADDTLLYIGSTLWIEGRIKNHEALTFWYGQVTRTTTEPFPTEEAARAGELSAIAAEHPRWNVRGRSIDHPDGPADFLWQIAAKYPNGLRRPMAASGASLDYHQKIAPGAAGVDLRNQMDRARCEHEGLIQYLLEIEEQRELVGNQRKILERHRARQAAA